MDELIEKLKVQIIEQLNLEEVSPEDIDADQELFNSDLGLDSIDALEIIVLLEKEYGVKIKSQEEGKSVFKSVRSLAEFIQQKQEA